MNHKHNKAHEAITFIPVGVKLQLFLDNSLLVLISDIFSWTYITKDEAIKIIPMVFKTINYFLTEHKEMIPSILLTAKWKTIKVRKNHHEWWLPLIGGEKQCLWTMHKKDPIWGSHALAEMFKSEWRFDLELIIW